MNDTLSQTITTQPVQPVEKKQVTYAVPLFIGACVVAMVIVMLSVPKSAVFSIRLFLSRYLLRAPYISVQTQPIGSPFIITAARLEKPGFISLYIGDDYDSPHSNVMGTSTLLIAGEYRSEIPIPFTLEDYESIINDFRLRDVDTSKKGHPVFVVGFYDDGDGKFSLEKDTIVHDAFGTPLIYKVLFY